MDFYLFSLVLTPTSEKNNDTQPLHYNGDCCFALWGHDLLAEQVCFKFMGEVSGVQSET